MVITACGKKGPPLPPLVKLPAAPANFAVERHGDDIDLQFTVPDKNTDNTKPANIDRVDVYALTGPANVTDAELFKYGTRVGSVDVKAPRDPNDTAEPDEDTGDVEAPTGKGLDQGAQAHLEEPVAPAIFTAAGIEAPKHGRHDDENRPLLGPSLAPSARTYVSVGISTRGKKGAVSKRVALPLTPPPPAPAVPKVTYSETAVSISWSASEDRSAGVLPSRPLGTAPPAVGFNVYELATEAKPAAETKPTAEAKPAADKPAPPGSPVEIRLTKEPVTSTEYTDSRMAWGTERCYDVRATERIGGVIIESEPSPKKCVTLKDTFPPAPPKQLTAVASEGSISLIWDANTEPDLAGYLVLRGTSADTLTAITPAPLAETTFKDDVQPGVKYMYAVKAVDKAGNASAPSNTVEETAR